MKKNKLDPTWSAESKKQPISSPWDVISSTPPPPPSSKNIKKHEWLGRAVIKPEDVHELETSSAIGQFAHKLPKEHAEEKAYKEYLHDRGKKAMAHHLSGIKGALAAGDKEAAKKHGIQYTKHAKSLGISTTEAPPEDVMKMVEEPKMKHEYKDHEADSLLDFAKSEETPYALRSLAGEITKKPHPSEFKSKPAKVLSPLESELTGPPPAPKSAVAPKGDVRSGLGHITNLKAKLGLKGVMPHQKELGLADKKRLK